MVITLIIVLGVVACWYGYLFFSLARNKDKENKSLREKLDGKGAKPQISKDPRLLLLVQIFNLFFDIEVRKTMFASSKVFHPGVGREILILLPAPSKDEYIKIDGSICGAMYRWYKTGFALPENFLEAYQNAVEQMQQNKDAGTLERMRAEMTLADIFAKEKYKPTQEELNFLRTILFRIWFVNEAGEPVYKRNFHIEYPADNLPQLFK